MSRRPRNNIARLPHELRYRVCSLLHDGCEYGEIRAALAPDLPSGTKLHNSTFAAYKAGAEYARYLEENRQWSERCERRRWAASMVNDGDGPRSSADVAAFEITEQLYDLAAGGILETGKDVARVANAIATMQRTQIAAEKAERDTRIQALEDEHASEVAELNARIAALEAALEEKTGSKTVDAVAVQDTMDEILGVKK